MKKRALVLSPFATLPLDAGQRKRVNQTTQIFKDLGFEITFLLYAFEDGWNSHANEEWLQDMRARWGEVIVLHANSQVGLPARSGWIHGIDEWWDDILETHLKEIFAYRFFDVFVVHNVWLSKAFDFAPFGTVRILDAHDVFSGRLSYFENTGTKPEFFITDPKSEALGANRANIVLGIQENDTEWFSHHSSADAVCLPYGAGQDERRNLRNDYGHKDKVVFGFLGSGHIFNTRGLAAYCAELAALVGRTAAPVELRIGGDACQAISNRGPWLLHGKVADEDAFFEGVDVMVAPVFEGSGFKVKMADASARGMPIIAASHATIGMHFDGEVIAESAKELALMTVNLALHRPGYRNLQSISQRAFLDLKTREARGIQKLKRKVATAHCAVLFDASGLSVEEASCVLLSWSGAFHLMRFIAKQLVVVPEPLREMLQRRAPPGVFFISGDEVQAHAKQIWRWITVKNTGPGRWGAAPEQIWIDHKWRAAISDTDAGPDEPAQAGESVAMFWHNITWDLMVRDILKSMAVSLKPQVGRSGTTGGETVVVVDRRSVAPLAAPFASLFPDFSVASLDTFEAFFELVTLITSGTARRLVIADQTHPARARVLRELCGIRGVDYVGPAGRGGLSSGTIPDADVKRIYDRFELQWRIQKHMGELSRKPDMEALDRTARPRTKPRLKLFTPTFVNELTYTAAERTVPKNNLHFLEHDSTGAPFRWTGPDRVSRFSFFLDRRAPLRLELSILDFRDSDRQAPIAVFLDGIGVEHAMLRRPGGGYAISAVLPARAESAPSPTEISFAVREVIPASAEDDRLLGFALSALHISTDVQTELVDPIFADTATHPAILHVVPRPHSESVSSDASLPR